MKEKIKLSYAIPVCNELSEIKRLIPFLLQTKQPDDEVVVLFDSTNGSDEVKDYLMNASERGEFKWYDYPFDGHFGNMKNKLTTHCSGDYIFHVFTVRNRGDFIFVAGEGSQQDPIVSEVLAVHDVSGAPDLALAVVGGSEHQL